MPGYNSATGALIVDDVRGRIGVDFTRPADTTAYAAGDVVNGAASTVPLILADVARRNGGSGEIVHITLETNNVTVTFGTFRVYFFNATFTIAADNAAFASVHAQRAALQGYVDLPILTVDSASAVGAVTKDDDVRIPFQCATSDDNLYAVIVAQAAHVPASGQIFRLSIGVNRD